MKFIKILITMAAIFALSIPAFASNHYSFNMETIDYLNDVGYSVDN